MGTAIKIGLIQTQPVAKPQENLLRVSAHVEELANKGAQIICPGELFEHPYFCQKKDKDFFALAQEVPWSTTNALSGLAKKTGVEILVPLFEKTREGKFFNSIVVVGPDGNILGVYRKMHIPSLPPDLYAENFYFSKGDTGFIVVDTPFGK